MMNLSAADFFALLPQAVTAVFAVAMLVAQLFMRRVTRSLWLGTAFLLALIASVPQLNLRGPALNGMLFIDGMSWVMTSTILVAALMIVLLSEKYLPLERVTHPTELGFLTAVAVIGGLVMASSGHLLVFFFGFELLSLSVYAMTGAAREERASSEGALKYFLLGAFSSAFLLYGIALIYGATGSLYYSTIATRFSADNLLLVGGLALILFGIAFKVSLVPFHLWSPDAYQGAPTSITIFMATVVKVAAFAAFLRLCLVPFPQFVHFWRDALWLLSVLSMTIGNLMALRQTSIKRLLAYSSIAHAGYIMIGVLALSSAEAISAIAFYLIVYTLMSICAFGVVLVVTAGGHQQYGQDNIGALAGLGWKSPFLGLVMTIAMLSLGGIPPLAGFTAKFVIFYTAITQGLLWLVIIAALNSLVSLYYYLRVIVVMYFSGYSEKSEREELSKTSVVVLAIASLAVIYLGIFSDRWLALLRDTVLG